MESSSDLKFDEREPNYPHVCVNGRVTFHPLVRCTQTGVPSLPNLFCRDEGCNLRKRLLVPCRSNEEEDWGNLPDNWVAKERSLYRKLAKKRKGAEKSQDIHDHFHGWGKKSGNKVEAEEEVVDLIESEQDVIDPDEVEDTGSADDKMAQDMDDVVERDEYSEKNPRKKK